MTSTKSFFNKGIYFNTLRRFRLGSAAYFLLLFLCVPLPLLTSGVEELTRSYFSMGAAFANEKSLLFQSGYIVMPLLLAFCVPTVVALLVFNSLHSPRHAIFVHSLPVTRKENFLSSLAAAFTLMWTPVLLIAGLLLIMSACGFSRVIGITPIFMWLAVQLFVTAVMFAAATFAAVISANGFAVAAINALLLGCPLIIAAGAQLAAQEFLFGFNRQAELFEKIIKLSPPCYIIIKAGADELYHLFAFVPTYLFAGAAIVLFAISLFLYERRKTELCGDVAAYKPVKLCLKYGVCAAMLIGCFGIFYCGLEMGLGAFLPLCAILCGATYFACEMLLQKNLRVFGRWKGLCGFFAVSACVAAAVVLTPCGGYETRIPEKSEILSATMFDNYSVEIPYCTDERIIDAVLDFHKQYTKDIPLTRRAEEKRNDAAHNGWYDVRVCYKLKDGSSLVRSYLVSSDDEYNAIMESMFVSEEYKEIFTGYASLVPENITMFTLSTNIHDFGSEDTITENTDEFFAALKKDIDAITYNEYREYLLPAFTVSLDDNAAAKGKHIFREELFERGRYLSTFFSINKNYTNTIAFLKKCGIWDKAQNEMFNNTYLLPQAFTKKNNVVTYDKEKTDSDSDIYCASKYFSKVEPADAQRIFSEKRESSYYDLPDGDYYAVFVTKSDGQYISSAVCYIEKSSLPDYLKKYIEAN